MRDGSATAASPRGAVQALLDNPCTDLVYFYKNLNGSCGNRQYMRDLRLWQTAVEVRTSNDRYVAKPVRKGR